MPNRRHSRRRMSGGGASEYGTALYGATPQAGEGNLIAMNKGVAMSGGMKKGGNPFTMSPETKYELAVSAFKINKDAEHLKAVEDALNELPKDKKIEAGKDVGVYKTEVVRGGRKSRMNFMMIPKMFMRMGRSRKHRRSTKRHHGKSRKHRK
uniref:Uncharacterized protein n=1 Tax=viral metagenome TaxID=1070528 RepID=A0A6C0D5G2_9ZZZZ